MEIDIESLKRKLLIKYPLFGMIVANTTFEAKPSIDTADTNGKIIRYNEAFISGLSEEEQIFIFAHEISHIAFDHIPKSKDKNMEIWNIATDAVINANLINDGLASPKGLVDIPNAINYDAEEMYQILLDKEKNNQQNKESNSQNNHENQSQNSQSNQNDSKEENNNGPSNHSIWKEALEELDKKESQNNTNSNENQQKDGSNNKNGQNNSLFDKIFNRNKKQEPANKTEEQSNESKKQEEIKKQEVEKLTNLGEKNTFKQNKIDKRKQLEELRQALVEKSHGSGTGSNREVIKINDIGISQPLIDWRRLLKDAVNYNIDWSYQNATIEDGIITPYLEELPQPVTEILLDTSGSINEILLKNFLRECKNILQNSKVKVGCFDDEFYGFTEIRNENDIDNMQFIGRGGTNFNAAVNAFTRRVENKIIFTDGEAPMPNTPIDAIWIVFGGRQINPKGGKVIYITDEQLRKLYLSVENNYQGRAR